MDLKKASILLVDDEVVLREILGTWLARAAGQLFFAEHGQEALEILAANRIDLIISDISMPVMDGIGLLRKINELGAHRPRLIFITGFSDFSLREAYDMGAEGILEKPVTREDLLNAAQRCLAEPEELWRERPAIPSAMKLEAGFEGLASALAQNRIAFGRRGFCIVSAQDLNEGPVKFTLEFKADQQVVSGHGIVRWVAHQEKQAGIEITQIDDTGRKWMIDLLNQNALVPLIPRSTETLPALQAKAI